MQTAPLSSLFPDGFVDAHHHVWAPETRAEEIGYGWLRDIGAPKPFGDPTPIQRDYLWPEFLTETDMAPLASVHVQTDGALPDPVAETRFVAEGAGHPLAIVGLADLCRTDLPDLLGRHGHTAHFRGVRQIVGHLPHRPDLSFAQRPLLSDPAWRDGLRAVAEAGQTFDLQLYPEQMAEAAEILSELPNLPVILDHAGSPYDRSEAGLAAWHVGAARLAELPQVSVKLSGWGMFDPHWTGDSIAPLVAHLLEQFGAERVMFGSNYPVEKLAKPYAQMLREMHGLIARLDQGALPAVFRDTAMRIYQPSA